MANEVATGVTGAWILFLLATALPVIAASALRSSQLSLESPLLFVNVLFLVFIDLPLWTVALRQQSTWLIDPSWHTIPLTVAFYYRTHPRALHDTARGQISTYLLLLWAMRLMHSYMRRERREGFGFGAREDWRYQDMRKKDPRNFWWKSIFLTYLSQQAMLVGLTLPFLAIYLGARREAPWCIFDSIGTVMCFSSLAFAHLGDTQLHYYMLDCAAAEREGKPRPKVLCSGVWRYHCHPAHFGEQLFWWGAAFFGFSATKNTEKNEIFGQIWPFAGAAFNSLIMAEVTRLVRRRMLRNPARSAEYESYLRRTSKWLPWPPSAHEKDV